MARKPRHRKKKPKQNNCDFVVDERKRFGGEDYGKQFKDEICTEHPYHNHVLKLRTASSASENGYGMNESPVQSTEGNIFQYEDNNVSVLHHGNDVKLTEDVITGVSSGENLKGILQLENNNTVSSTQYIDDNSIVEPEVEDNELLHINGERLTEKSFDATLNENFENAPKHTSDVSDIPYRNVIVHMEDTDKYMSVQDKTKLTDDRLNYENVQGTPKFNENRDHIWKWKNDNYISEVDLHDYRTPDRNHGNKTRETTFGVTSDKDIKANRYDYEVNDSVLRKEEHEISRSTEPSENTKSEDRNERTRSDKFDVRHSKERVRENYSDSHKNGATKIRHNRVVREDEYIVHDNVNKEGESNKLNDFSRVRESKTYQPVYATESPYRSVMRDNQEANKRKHSMKSRSESVCSKTESIPSILQYIDASGDTRNRHRYKSRESLSRKSRSKSLSRSISKSLSRSLSSLAKCLGSRKDLDEDDDFFYIDNQEELRASAHRASKSHLERQVEAYTRRNRVQLGNSEQADYMEKCFDVSGEKEEPYRGSIKQYRDCVQRCTSLDLELRRQKPLSEDEAYKCIPYIDE